MASSRVTGNGAAVTMFASSVGDFRDTVVAENLHGIRVSETGLFLTDSTIRDNGDFGIDADNGGVHLTGSRVTGHTLGVSLKSDFGSEINESDISRNEVGLRVGFLDPPAPAGTPRRSGPAGSSATPRSELTVSGIVAASSSGPVFTGNRVANNGYSPDPALLTHPETAGNGAYFNIVAGTMTVADSTFVNNARYGAQAEGGVVDGGGNLERHNGLDGCLGLVC